VVKTAVATEFNTVAKRLSLDITGDAAAPALKLAAIASCVPTPITVNGNFDIYKTGTLTSITRAPLGQPLKFTNLTTTSPGVIQATDALGDVMRVTFQAAGDPIIHLQLAAWKATAVHGLGVKCVFSLTGTATDGTSATWNGSAKNMILP